MGNWHCTICLGVLLIVRLLLLDSAVVVDKGESLFILGIGVARGTRVTRTKVALDLLSDGLASKKKVGSSTKLTLESYSGRVLIAAASCAPLINLLH